MSRRIDRRQVDWMTPEGNKFTWEHVQIEVLMDIRAELKSLNETLRCHRVWQGMDALQRIDKRLAKKVSLRRAK